MAYNAELYSEIEPRLADWLQNTGGSVSDLPLDLLNRSQHRIEGERQWSYLTVEATLTLSGTSATLPADFGKLIALGLDPVGNGRISWFFVNRGKEERWYKIIPAFSKATGHAWTIKWETAPSSSPVIRYQKRLVDFVGTGTEYSFFPGELLLRTAQMIRIVEKGLSGPEMRAITDDRDRLFHDYKQAHQYEDAPMDMVQIDEAGNDLSMDIVSLDGNDLNTSRDGYDRSYDRG